MEYKVVNAAHLRTLESITNLNIKKGWIPQGGIHSKSTKEMFVPVFGIGISGELEEMSRELSTTNHWYQAMTRDHKG